MTYEELEKYLDESGVTVQLRGEDLVLSGPPGSLNDEIRTQCQVHRLGLMKRKDRDDPVSWFQERLWFLHQRAPSDLSYNIPILLQLEGPLDTEALVKSLTTIVLRQEVLRTVYRVTTTGEVVAHTTSVEAFAVSRVSCREEQISTHIQEVAQHRFDLENGPVFIARFLTVRDDFHVLLLNVHHIAADGWSMQGVFLKELRACYDAHHSGQPPCLPELSHSYRDYARQQRSIDTSASLAHFLERLEGYEDTLQLPTTRLRPARGGQTSASFTHRYPPEFGRELARFSARHGATVFFALLAGLGICVSRATGRSDLCLGTTTSGRDRVEWEGLIGFFINILPLRLFVDDALTVTAFMKQVRDLALEAFEHQDVPFEQILTRGGFSRTSKENPLVPIVLRHQNFPRAAVDQPWAEGLRVGAYRGSGSSEREAKSNIAARCEIELSYTGSGENLEVEVAYASDIYDQASIERLMAHQQRVLEQMFEDDQRQLGSLDVLTAAETRNLLEAQGPRRSLHEILPFPQRFSRLARSRPADPCCIDGDGSWSFARIEVESNQLAHVLRELGVGPGDIVGLCMPRQRALLVGLLGIWKTGAAYVPLDPNYPESYLGQILEDAAPRLVVTFSAHRDKLHLPDRRLLLLDRERSALNEASTSVPVSDPASVPSADAAAYLMYTSGSTGVPKGVRVPHRQLMNWQNGIEDLFPFGADEVSAQKTTMAFAVSVKETWAGVLCGRPLVFLDDRTVQDPAALAAALVRHRVSRMNLVPSHLAALLAHVQASKTALPSLYMLIAAGEPLTAEVVQLCRQVLPHVRLINNYGCTELNDITYYDTADFREPEGFVPIGRPIQNTSLYVLDRQGRLVPEGVAGELHVAGLSLSEGYHHLPQLTAEKYVEAPLSLRRSLSASSNSDSSEAVLPARLFNTGDVVRWLPDGNLDYVGRWDLQVKVRGFRVDVRHVEKVLGDFAQVGQRAVVADGQRLVAFFVPSTRDPLDLDELRAFLAARLPSYMVPDAFVALGELPRLPNGKLNRRALKPSEADLQQSEAYGAPQTETERLLVEIWADVLELPAHTLGRRAHFFEIGGHSLAATRVVARIKDRTRKGVALSELFEHPRLESLARHIEQTKAQGSEQRDEVSIALDHPHRSTQKGSGLLDGKVVLVTGASRGIGRSIALLLAGEGALVALNFRDSRRQAEEVRETIVSFGGTAEVVQGDVTDPAQVVHLVDWVTKRWGPIDVLVANASIGFRKRAFADYEWADMEAKVSGELKAIFYPCQAVIPGMKRKGQGSIIALSSALSKHASPGFVAQSTAKAALDAFVRSLAVELGEDGIRVNTVAPGVTLTDAAANMTREHKKTTAHLTPLGRNGVASDMAGAVLFFASDLSRFSTGTYLPVDGGFTML